MSVMYTPSSGSSGNRGGSNYNRGGRNYRSSEQTTQNIRNWSGFFTFVGICVFTYLGFQFISVVLVGMGTAGIAVLLVVSAGSLITTTVVIFKAVKERKVSLVLLPIGLFMLSFFVPGAPILIAVVYIGASCVYVIYFVVSATLHSRAIAVVIAAIPVLGSLYYVPATLSNANLVTHFRAITVTEAQFAPQLTHINQALSKTYKKSAVVSYQIRNNRLYADICQNGDLKSIELNTRNLVQTKIPWLERDLSQQVGVNLGPGAIDTSSTGYSNIAEMIKPVADILREYDAVMVADGALVNFPHQAILQTSRVFRSVSLDENQIEQNITQWTSSPILRPEQVEIVNALPQSTGELEQLGLSGEVWEKWRNLHGQFEQSLPQTLSSKATGKTVTKAAFLDALQSKQCVVFVIAHCDGFSIRLPNGEAIEVQDLNQIKDAIQANHPKVFLFSCETARLNNVQSFAKALLDHGAEAVVAPVTKLSADEALQVFKSFLSLAFGNSPTPINEAFQRALKETGRKMMEIWVAGLVEPSENTQERWQDFTYRPSYVFESALKRGRT